MIKKFDEIKNKYLNLTENDDSKFLKNKTINGVYLLYFITKNINTIIPVYIGQSININNRFYTHKKEINKLFKLKNDELNEHINSGKQDGNFLYAKIVLFLKNNNLTPENIKIKILESNLEKKYLRLIKEQNWINEWSSEFYGFNQLIFIQLIHQWQYSKTKFTTTQIKKIINYGSSLMHEFNFSVINYGYSYFNIYNFICFSTQLITEIEENNKKFYHKIANEKYYINFKNELIIFSKNFNELYK